MKISRALLDLKIKLVKYDNKKIKWKTSRFFRSCTATSQKNFQLTWKRKLFKKLSYCLFIRCNEQFTFYRKHNQRLTTSDDERMLIWVFNSSFLAFFYTVNVWKKLKRREKSSHVASEKEIAFIDWRYFVSGEQ